MTHAETISMDMAFLAAPSDLMIPARAPSIMMNTDIRIIGRMYQKQRSRMSDAPMTEMTGSMRTKIAGIDARDIASVMITVCAARELAWALSCLPRHLAMAVDAPTPTAVPTPLMIQ